MRQYIVIWKRWSVACYFFTALIAGAEPTEFHRWKSTTGTTLEARATAVRNGSVTLEPAIGKTVTLKVEMLIEADREFLKTHFHNDPTAVIGTDIAPEIILPEAPPIATPGSVLGPVEAKGSHYFYYVPKSLKPGRKTALLFFTGAGIGYPARLALLQEGAEISGWILALSVESCNDLLMDACNKHAKNCLDHLLATQPIDKSRVYFGGNSGGARVAFANSVKFNGRGVLALIAGAQPGEIKSRMDYYFVNGATDYNRCGSAHSFKEARSTAALRYHPGPHEEGLNWLQTEGMIWLQTRWQMRTKASGPEREEFENRVLTWAESLPEDQDHRTGWWANYLLATPGLTPIAKIRATQLNQKYGTKPSTLAYIEGIKALEKFALDELSDGPACTPDCHGHTTPAIQKALDLILKTHATTPLVKDLLIALKNKTCN
jgi:hypothetical protein